MGPGVMPDRSRPRCTRDRLELDTFTANVLMTRAAAREAGVAISRNRAHIPTMADKHPKGQHNPSQKSLQRWDNEGGAIKGVRAKRPRDPSRKPAHSPGKRSPARARRD